MKVILPVHIEDQNSIKDWLCLLACASVILCFVKYLYSRRKLKKLIDRLDGPKHYLFVDISIFLGLFQRSIPGHITASTVLHNIQRGTFLLYSKEKMCRVWVFRTPIVFLYGAEVVKPLIAANKFVSKTDIMPGIDQWLGNSLLVSSGRQWAAKRKLLTPTFHFKILEDFLPVMNRHSEILVRNIRQMLNNSWIDIVPVLSHCTLNVINETAMGVSLHHDEKAFSEYIKAVHQLLNCIFTRFRVGWFQSFIMNGFSAHGKHYKDALRVIQETTAKVIKEKKEKTSENTGNRPEEEVDGVVSKKKVAFLDLLLEKHLADPTFTEKDIRDEVNTFMFGGYDTTATTLTWILYLLGLHPEVQEKMYEEVNQVFGNGVSHEVTMEELSKLKYTDMVMKECQRLYSTIAAFARHINKDIEIGDKVIPKGTLAVIDLQQLHKDKDVFPNPEHFDPERFSEENCQGRHPYAFMPFSAGPRNCIGRKFAVMEEKLILSHVMLNFKFRSLDQRDKMNVSPDIVLRPVGPVRLHFQNR